MRKMAVSGACITPDIRPAIATSAKLVSGREKPQRLKSLATTKPRTPPIKSVGPKVPPTPPPALVSDIEKTLKRKTIRKKSGISHGLDLVRTSERKVVPIAPFTSPLSRFVSEP